jgi:hypothetical protein
MQDAKAGHRGVLAIFFLNGALFGAWASRVPAIKADLAMDEAELGLVLLCMAAGEREGDHGGAPMRSAPRPSAG